MYRDEVSQTAVSVLTKTPEHGSVKGAHEVPYTESISPGKLSGDEVPHHAEVQTFREEGSTEMVDRTEDKARALGQVCVEPQGYSSYRED
jgi:hypothetical protein